MAEQRATGAENIRWKLNDLYPDHETLQKELDKAEADAKAFAETYRGALETIDGDGFTAAMQKLADLHDRVGRAYTYAYLNWSTNTEDAERGALLQKVREGYTQIGQHLIFFEVEWADLDDATAEKLLKADKDGAFRHYLELKREQKEHILSEPEEKIMAEKAVTGWSAWNRFFDETLGAARFSLNGEVLPLQQVLTKLHEPDRSERKAAHKSITEGLELNRRSLAYVFNTILADKAANDRLRGYAHWLDSRNESNEISNESVEALIQAVVGRCDLVQRFYDLKRRLLGLDEMLDYDRYAPLGEAEEFILWDEARKTVVDAYTAFHPEMGGIADRFFEDQWIDAPPEAGKRGGAFSHGAVPSAHPYVFMNYTGKVRDVQTLAHELGHGIHQYLSREQGVFHADTPLTTAETASVFGEMLVFQRLLAELEDERDRLALLIEKIDDSMATVFRQVTMNRFEERIHRHRREKGELSADDFRSHWMDTQKAMYGSSVSLTDEYGLWWSYIPHFVHTPGYVYAYAFGELLVLALYQVYEEEGEAFAAKYRDLLAAGGSDWPHVLVGRLGIDLNDSSFWMRGLDAIEELITRAEKIAERIT
ncbi:MAG: M3 family oligoendopeptidase [Rubricoccaceae bacterium]|nr:M3 family oligoendopeptidase [Rubricoccaceae bacterium]